MTIIYYLVYYILLFIPLYCLYFWYDIPETIYWVVVVLFAILPFVLYLISRYTGVYKIKFIREEGCFKPKGLPLIGILILIFSLFLHLLLSAGQNNYVEVAGTEDIEQVHKIQTYLSDNYFPVKITKGGEYYNIEVINGRDVLEHASLFIADSNLELKNVKLEIGVDYGNLHTLEKRLQKRLNELLPHIIGVHKANVYLIIPLDFYEPNEAQVYIETDDRYMPERIEHSVRNLVTGAAGVDKENLEIEIKVNKCTDDMKCRKTSEYYLEAQKLYGEGKYQEALNLLVRENKISPNRNKRAITLLKELIEVNKQIEQSPDDYKLYIKRGDIRSVESIPQGITSDPDGAISDYSKALELNPNAHEVYARRGKAYTGICEQKHPDAQCQHNPKDIKRGISDLKKAIKYNKGDDYAFEFIGDMYFYKKDYASAISYYERISEGTLFPKESSWQTPKYRELFDRYPEEFNYIALRMVTCYKELKQYNKAKALCNKILSKTNDKDYIKRTKKLMKYLK